MHSSEERCDMATCSLISWTNFILLDPASWPVYTYFPVLLFIMLYQSWFVLTERAFESVGKILW